MNDRELLEYAAKAAGIDFSNWDWSIYGGFCCGSYDDYEKWNPLTDDGDALRLVVKLKIDIHFTKQTEISQWEVCCDWDFCEPFNAPGCDGEITRRAIVRAAAEIGKAMP